MVPAKDMTLPELAQELGGLRVQLKQLKEREAELRGAILAARPNGPVQGGGYEITVRNGSARRFEKSRLPDAILADPRYWVARQTATVMTRRAENRSQGVAASRANDGFQVIERW